MMKISVSMTRGQVPLYAPIRKALFGKKVSNAELVMMVDEKVVVFYPKGLDLKEVERGLESILNKVKEERGETEGKEERGDIGVATAKTAS